MNILTNLTPHQLRQAANIQERIFALQAELAKLVGGGGPETVVHVSRKGRRLSAQGLANIREGARKRWARERTANGAGGPKPRRKISAAGRARISAMLKARWAAAKKAGRKAL